MHEFSIAVNIVELAEAEALRVNANSIKELVLDIGTMSGIEFYALDAAMEMAVKNTMLDKTDVKVNRIQAQARCTDCQHVFDIEQVYDLCPKCGGLYHEILSGKELQIKSIVVDVDD